MNEFKVGDWVTTKAGYTKQISGLTRDACDTLSIGNTSVGVNVVFKNEIELWQPKEGEWCWFWDNFNNPFIGKFVARNGDNYQYKHTKNDKVYSAYKCEPFVGELPSFLKEHQCNQLT